MADGSADQSPPDRSADRTAADERTLWSGHSSQYENTGIFLRSGLELLAIVGLGGAAMLWLGSADFYLAHRAALLAALGLAALWPLGRALLRALQVQFLVYEVTTQRLRVRRGVLSRVTEELELYRVKDLTLQEPFLYRLLGLSNLHLHTSDRSNPLVTIAAIPRGQALREQLRDCVERQRKIHGVRELDV